MTSPSSMYIDIVCSVDRKTEPSIYVGTVIYVAKFLWETSLPSIVSVRRDLLECPTNVEREQGWSARR